MLQLMQPTIVIKQISWIMVLKLHRLRPQNRLGVVDITILLVDRWLFARWSHAQQSLKMAL